MGAWMIFIPRSPAFLLTKGNIEEAKHSLQWFRGGHSVDVQEELEEIKEMVEERKHSGDVSFWTLMTEPRYVKPLVIMLVLMLLQQLSGISYILGYSTIIMKVNLIYNKHIAHR